MVDPLWKLYYSQPSATLSCDPTFRGLSGLEVVSSQQEICFSVNLLSAFDLPLKLVSSHVYGTRLPSMSWNITDVSTELLK